MGTRATKRCRRSVASPTSTFRYRGDMGALAEAFVHFLGHVHRSNAAKTEGEKTAAGQRVGEAAKTVMELYVAYKPADPVDLHDEAAVKLITQVKDVEALATCVIAK